MQFNFILSGASPCSLLSSMIDNTEYMIVFKNVSILPKCDNNTKLCHHFKCEVYFLTTFKGSVHLFSCS